MLARKKSEQALKNEDLARKIWTRQLQRSIQTGAKKGAKSKFLQHDPFFTEQQQPVSQVSHTYILAAAEKEVGMSVPPQSYICTSI